MSAGLKGDISQIRRLESRLRELPRTLAIQIAPVVAATITKLAIKTFNAGQNAYGDAWEPGAEGQRVTLKKSGRAAGGVAYVATGTRLRARLGPSYMRYQVGARAIFPRNGAKLPPSYVDGIRSATNEHIESALKAASS